MLSNEIDTLIDRARKIPENYSLSIEEISLVESELKVKFGDLFVILNGIYRYDCFSTFEFHAFDLNQPHSVIYETIGLRKACKLPDKYIVISEDDVSMLLFEMQENNMRVIWCGHEEFERLCEGKPMEEDYTIFETFADFYEYLLDEEEKERLGLEA